MLVSETVLKEACHTRPQLACAHGVPATFDASKTVRLARTPLSSPRRRSLPTLWPEVEVSHAYQARVRPPVGSTSATVLASCDHHPRRHEARSSSTVARDSTVVAPDTLTSIAPQTLRDSSAAVSCTCAPSIRHMLLRDHSTRGDQLLSLTFAHSPVTTTTLSRRNLFENALLCDLIQIRRRLTTVDHPFGGSAVLAPWRRFGSERSTADDLYGYRVRACSALLALWRDVLEANNDPRTCWQRRGDHHQPPTESVSLISAEFKRNVTGLLTATMCFLFFTAVYTTEGQVYTWTATTPSTVTPVTFSTGSVMDAADCEPNQGEGTSNPVQMIRRM